MSTKKNSAALKSTTANNQRANVKNTNNAEHKAAANNKSNQGNSNHLKSKGEEK